LELKRPPDPTGTNPEALFAAAYAAWFEGAFRLAARDAGRELTNVAITVRVTLNVRDARVFDLSVEIHVQADGLGSAETESLMATAHQICPYSRAVRGNVEVQLFAEAWQTQ